MVLSTGLDSVDLAWGLVNKFVVRIEALEMKKVRMAHRKNTKSMENELGRKLSLWFRFFNNLVRP